MAARRAARALLKPGAHLFARDVKSRNEAGDHADDSSDSEGERERYGVDVDGVDARKSGRTQRDERSYPCEGHSQANCTAERSQQQAFGNKLPNDAPPRCAERGTNRKFSAALRAAGEQQVDDVDAGDSEDEQDCAQHREQRGPDGMGNVILQRVDYKASF